jgi:soluble lytic murein transglycosylase-like protein
MILTPSQELLMNKYLITLMTLSLMGMSNFVNAGAQVNDHIVKTYKVKPAIAKSIVLETAKASKKYKVPQSILLAIIEKESTFKPNAVNNGSFGLMQIHVKSHKTKVKGKNIKEIGTNVDIGSSILSDCKSVNKDYLTCYHGQRNGYAANIRSKSVKYKKLLKEGKS